MVGGALDVALTVRAVTSAHMRTVRAVVSAIVALAVVAGPLMPPLHLHRSGIEGRADPQGVTQPPLQVVLNWQALLQR